MSEGPDDLGHEDCSVCDDARRDAKEERIAYLEGELSRHAAHCVGWENRHHELEQEANAMRKQIRDALAELPHVAGPLAHRIRFQRDQYDGWCNEYKEKIARLRECIQGLIDAHNNDAGMDIYDALIIDAETTMRETAK